MSALRAIISVALLIGVVAWIGHEYGIGTVADDLSHLSALTVGAVIVALIANAFMAALRFKLMTGSSGHPIGFGTAMAAVGAGSLGGAVFFQIAGQLMSR